MYPSTFIWTRSMPFNKVRHTIVRFYYEQILYEIIQNY